MEINRDPLSASVLRSQIDNRLTSYLKNLGLDKWDKAYYWYSDYGSYHYRKVFHYVYGKGLHGTFLWGYCFDFIPTYGNTKNLRWHRTEKSIKLHLWEGASFLWDKNGMSRNSFTNFGKISHWGETEFNATFNEVFEVCKPEIEKWFKADHTLEDCLHLLEQQLEVEINHATKHPSLRYVHCFLLAKIGRSAEAIDAMEKLKSAYCAYDHKWEPLFTQLVSIIKKTVP